MEGRPLLLAALLVSLGSTAQAQSPRCTRETLSVHDTPVTVVYCVSGEGLSAPGHDLPVRVSETFSAPRGSFSQEATLRFIAGEDSSRVIQDVGLARLGMEGTLHLTLVYHGGAVRVDSAMLTPGALTVK